MKAKSFPLYDIEDFKFGGVETDFYVNNIKSHFKNYGHLISKPHQHSFYFCLLITKGSGKHEIDFKIYDAKPGSVFLMFPGQAHDWKMIKDIDGYVFFHTKEYYNIHFTDGKVENFPFYSCIHNTSLISLNAREQEKVKSYFIDMFNEYKGNGLMKFQKICSMLNLLYIDLSRVYIPDSKSPGYDDSYLSKMRKFNSLVEKNYKQIKSVGVYAEKMHMSEKHLNRICKTTLNMTTSEVILQRVLLEAKRMLVYSNYSVSQIAEELGYSDNSYFFRVFKKKNGKTPLEYMRTERIN